jgi:hypothetical protein
VSGQSRDEKPRNAHVPVGLVQVDGWPIAHRVFAGNKRNASTASDAVRNLERRLTMTRTAFAADRGRRLRRSRPVVDDACGPSDRSKSARLHTTGCRD